MGDELGAVDNDYECLASCDGVGALGRILDASRGANHGTAFDSAFGAPDCRHRSNDGL
jgi:hypothetical protein